MTLFWLQVTMLLIGTALHVLGRIYEVRWQQYAHYLDRWSKEFDEALEEAVTLSINGEHENTSHWVFSRQGLEDFKSEILRELP